MAKQFLLTRSETVKTDFVETMSNKNTNSACNDDF